MEIKEIIEKLDDLIEDFEERLRSLIINFHRIQDHMEILRSLSLYTKKD